jgi:hypothetical protein
MSIVRAAVNAYGPATLDIQIEQGADFSVDMTINRGTVPWDLTNATLEAYGSSTWLPGQAVKLSFTVAKVDAASGKIRVSFPSADSLAIPLPRSPATTPSISNLKAPRNFKFGGWILNVTDAGTTVRLVDGDIYLDRDPCLM